MGFVDWVRATFAGEQVVEGGGCVACGSKDLAELAPRVYRCNQCGYEGGEGYAAYAVEARKAKLRTLDDEALIESVRAGVESARLSDVAADGIAIPPPRPMISAHGGGFGRHDSVDEEERRQLRMERERIRLQERRDLDELGLVLDVLVERGPRVLPLLESLDVQLVSNTEGRRLLRGAVSRLRGLAEGV